MRAGPSSLRGHSLAEAGSKCDFVVVETGFRSPSIAVLERSRRRRIATLWRSLGWAPAGWPADAASCTTIVVALGYEQYKAQGASEYFDPAETWVFMPQSPIKAYDDAVRENNKDLIETAEREGRCIDYEVDDPERTFGELIRVAASTRARATPLILPFGPKVFFAISLFVPILYEEIGVWLISGGDVPLASSNHVASGSLIAFDVRLRPSAPQTGDPI